MSSKTISGSVGAASPSTRAWLVNAIARSKQTLPASIPDSESEQTLKLEQTPGHEQVQDMTSPHTAHKLHVADTENSPAHAVEMPSQTVSVGAVSPSVRAWLLDAINLSKQPFRASTMHSESEKTPQLENTQEHVQDIASPHTANTDGSQSPAVEMTSETASVGAVSPSMRAWLVDSINMSKQPLTSPSFSYPESEQTHEAEDTTPPCTPHTDESHPPAVGMTPKSSSVCVASTSVHAWIVDAIARSNATLPTTLPAPTSTSNMQAESEQHETSELVQDTTPQYTRKLVTVRMIDSVSHWSGQNDLITIEGWNVIAKKKMRLSPGDLVVFCEIDSFLPADGKHGAAFSQARIGNTITFDGQNGYRVGTQTYVSANSSKINSQGHIFKLADFSDLHQDVIERRENYGLQEPEFKEFIQQVDYSAMLGVKKWESDAERSTAAQAAASCKTKGGEIKGPSSYKVPAFIMKTDMERVQNCPNLFIKPKYKKQIFQETVKMDGCTMSCYFINNTSRFFSHLNAVPTDKRAVHPNGRFGVCSKKQDLVLTNWKPLSKDAYWSTALKNNIHTKLAKLGKTIAVQGELVGWNINDNRHGYGPDEYDFFVFSVIDIEAGKRCTPQATEEFAREHGFKHVEVIGYHTVPRIARHHQDLIDRAELKPGEGLVFKNCTDGRWFKIVSNWYLTRQAELMPMPEGPGGWTAGPEDFLEYEDDPSDSGVSMSSESNVPPKPRRYKTSCPAWFLPTIDLLGPLPHELEEQAIIENNDFSKPPQNDMMNEHNDSSKTDASIGRVNAASGSPIPKKKMAELADWVGDWHL
ncbi:hypothetical protein B0T22DRAFT_489664 [Podospora appendiculata]|uniref:RNA ligase domain-containing protein n=1 Tax=Podospora appendiculata TaxID=314037 RepID=A0AAE0X8J7_9PEZI|nr:hypothetical protein B0T22DRAFT_489664 [Podospora appendiculata]